MKFVRFRTHDHTSRPFATAAVMSVMLTGSAVAQTEPTPTPPSPTVPRPPATPTTPDPSPAPPPTPAPQTNNLSEELKKGEGVITPPPVGDPDIVLPPPDTNAKIRVIPPPGEPGGDASTQPK